MAKSAVAKPTNRSKNTANGKSGVARRKEPSKVRKATAPTQHVVEKDGVWAVKSAGRSMVAYYPSKPQAIDEARRIARILGSELLVHGKSGQIFQHSPIPSELREDEIRQAIRSANQDVKKTAPARRLKKTAAKKK